MNCEEAFQLIDAHLDRELDVATDREVTQHLETCARCTAEADSIRALKAALQSEAIHFRASDAFRSRLEGTIATAIPSNQQRKPQPAPGTRSMPRWRNAAIAAMAAMLALAIAPRFFHSGEDDFLSRELVAAHVRSTQADHLTDVASTDRHTVKPWFEGKIDFSPPVADFEPQGFKLIGGRVDYLDDRTVAALIYRHGPHIINVFIWPADAKDRAPSLTTRSGYNLDSFTHAGMNFRIVSDTSTDEMEKLASLLAG